LSKEAAPTIDKRKPPLLISTGGAAIEAYK